MKDYNKKVLKKAFIMGGSFILFIIIVGLSCLNIYTALGLLWLSIIIGLIYSVYIIAESSVLEEEADNCNVNNNSFYESNPETGMVKYKKI